MWTVGRAEPCRLGLGPHDRAGPATTVPRPPRRFGSGPYTALLQPSIVRRAADKEDGPARAPLAHAASATTSPAANNANPVLGNQLTGLPAGYAVTVPAIVGRPSSPPRALPEPVALARAGPSTTYINLTNEARTPST
jgi:hypothetical protein